MTAGDHIAVLPQQTHLMPAIEQLAAHLGIAKDAKASRELHSFATLDTPFDLEIEENLPPKALEGMEFGWGPVSAQSCRIETVTPITLDTGTHELWVGALHLYSF